MKPLLSVPVPLDVMTSTSTAWPNPVPLMTTEVPPEVGPWFGTMPNVGCVKVGDGGGLPSAGVTAVSEVSLFTTTLVAATPPIVTLKDEQFDESVPPHQNPLPEMVTEVPPAAAPIFWPLLAPLVAVIDDTVGDAAKAGVPTAISAAKPAATRPPMRPQTLTGAATCRSELAAAKSVVRWFAVR